MSDIAPGHGQTWWLAGMLLLIFSSLLGAMNFIATIIQLRAPGMTWFRLPFFVWSQFVTAFLLLLAFPALQAAAVLQGMSSRPERSSRCSRVFCIYVLVRFRSGHNPQANYRGVKGRWSTWIEGGVLVAEIVLLAFFSIPFWRANVDAMPPSDGATMVRVVAEQFAWHVHYPGPDGVFGRTDISLVSPDNPLGLDRSEQVGKDDIISNNRMNLPVSRPVVIFLSSKDVIHSFGLPQMRVKQDAIPGIVQPVWFTPTKIGEWNIACSQLCGLGHFRMRGMYAIRTQSDYDAWLKEEAEYLANP